MKKLHFYITTLLLPAATLLTGCSTDDTTPGETAQTPITFEADVESSQTRAYTAGIIDYATLADAGFGVYAYGLTSGNWYNKKVSHSGSTYLPPNTFVYPGNWSYDDVQDWKKQTIDFYAYAPYVEGSSTYITSLLPTSGKDDPVLTYKIATTPDESVDLLWGIEEKSGKPWTGATHDNTGGSVLFTFYHALAAIGFHVQAIIDKDNDKSDFTDESNVAKVLGESGNYKITIKKLTLKGNFYSEGDLNLHNTTEKTPRWTTKSTNLTEQTLMVGNSLINADFKHPDEDATDATKAETIMNKNNIVGVTQKAQQLLVANNSNGKEQCFFVIPNSNSSENYTVTLYWCISGKAPDGNYIYEDRKSVINISDLALEAGIKYYLNFVIGLTTLKLDVTATDWTDTPQAIDIIIEHGTSANSSLAPQR